MTIQVLGHLRRYVDMLESEIEEFNSSDALNELWKNTYDLRKDFPLPIDFTQYKVIMISKNLHHHEGLGIVDISKVNSVAIGIYYLSEYKKSSSAFHLFMLTPKEVRIDFAVLTKSKELMATSKALKKLDKQLETLRSKGYKKMGTASIEVKSTEISNEIETLVLKVSGMNLRTLSLTPDNPAPQAE